MFRLACGLYDQLEVFSIKKNKVRIIYLDNNGTEMEKEGVITDIIAKNGNESIIIDKDISIDTKEIVSVNNVEFK